MNPFTALVTGGSRGIGKSIVARLHSEKIEVLSPTREELDLSSDDSIHSYLRGLNISVDILINNAGINVLGGGDEFQDQDLEETLQINLIAPMKIARFLIPGMKKKRFGRIVNISSIWSLVSKPRRVTYTTTKTAINGFTRALAVELAPYNILVNSVAPGFVNTELTRQNNTPNDIEAIEKLIPIKRLAEPEEIAELVCFLTSPKNSYLTGQTLTIDGGFTCQ